jgi:hypothetical protein
VSLFEIGAKISSGASRRETHDVHKPSLFLTGSVSFDGDASTSIIAAQLHFRTLHDQQVY